MQRQALHIPQLQSNSPQNEYTWAVPGSKSICNRALILASLATGTSTLRGFLHSDDTHHMRKALQSLGMQIKDVDATTVQVDGGRDAFQPAAESLFIGNSGTTVRFVTALAALINGHTALHGDEHMAKRPIADLLEAMQQAGISSTCATGCPPLTIAGTGALTGSVQIAGDKSSQYLSALLMAGAAGAGFDVCVTGELVSRPYVDMTLAQIRSFAGIAEERATNEFHVGGTSLVAQDYAIEPDASAASYPLALAVACQRRIRVPGLHKHSLQGDVAFAECLERCGAKVIWENDAIVVDGSHATLHGIDVDMFHISDTVMSLAAIAPLLQGPTTIRNIANIRIKETDRLMATVQELRKLGQYVEYGEDCLRIHPRPIQDTEVHCYADHRMAMSFAILGAASGQVHIDDPDCVGKTYPNFWHDLGSYYQGQQQDAPWLA